MNILKREYLLFVLRQTSFGLGCNRHGKSPAEPSTHVSSVKTKLKPREQRKNTQGSNIQDKSTLSNYTNETKSKTKTFFKRCYLYLCFGSHRLLLLTSPFLPPQLSNHFLFFLNFCLFRKNNKWFSYSHKLTNHLLLLSSILLSSPVSQLLLLVDPWYRWKNPNVLFLAEQQRREAAWH